MTSDGEYSDVSMVNVANAMAHLRGHFPPEPQALMRVSVSWVSEHNGEMTVTIADAGWPDDEDEDTDEFEDDDE